MSHVLNNPPRLKKAQEHLAQARLLLGVRDEMHNLQLDEPRAQILITKKDLARAEALTRQAVSLLENNNGGQARDSVHKADAPQALLAEALITQGIAQARLDKGEAAALIFQRAIVVALQAGAQDKAALAALTLLEEIEQLSTKTLCEALEIATEMPESMGLEMLKRVASAGVALVSRVQAKRSHQEVPEVAFKLPVNLEYEMLVIERFWIKKALADAEGSIIQAADFLGLKPKKLFRWLRRRHPLLLKQLSPPIRLRPED